jgi:hypothetical protein
MKYRLTGEPALVLTLINAVVALVAGMIPALTTTEAGAINAAAAAVLALVAAWAVKPFPVALLIGAFNTLAALAIAFYPHLHLDQNWVGLADAVIAAAFGVWMRMHVSPAPAGVSK